MKLKLPKVTLVMVDATCPELAALALKDTLDQVEFGDTLVFSPVDLEAGGTWHKTEAWTSREAMCEYLWYAIPKLIKTPYIFNIDYDSWVIDATQWDDAFMRYDFGGPPWWYDDGRNVGNGHWRSLRLMNFLSEHKDVFPLGFPEDDLLGRAYRNRLEACGFRYMPKKLASKFGFECTRPSAKSKHFMFHDSFNFPAVLSGDRLKERLRLLGENEYIKQTPKLRDIQAGRSAIIMPQLEWKR